jgi:alkylated DNA repair dioxygenase AlkB
MDTLFPIEPILPAGFSYHENFLTIEEEQRLCKEILKMNMHTFLFQGFEAKRKVASFGYDWSFEKRILSKGKDIPSVFDFLINKVAAYLQIDRDQFAELLVTDYPIGSVINWHRDAPPFDIIAGLSLLSDCTFKLRPHDKSKQGRGSVISLLVKRRSLYVMQGPSRSEWQHSIIPVREIRYSITLRTLSHKK